MLKESTQMAQSGLAKYTRTGELVDLKGARSDRLPTYRRLVFNVVFDSMTSAYPIARKLIDKEWKGLVHEFFLNHDCSNYQVWRMPHEFKSYLEEYRTDLLAKWPFLFELLLFEWTEIEVYSEEDIAFETPHTSGTWYEQNLVINPHHRLLELNYPVFKGGLDNGPEKGKYFLLVVRNLKDFRVQFVELSPLFALAINNTSAGGDFKDALFALAAQAGVDRETVIKKAQPIVELLFIKGLFLGYA